MTQSIVLICVHLFHTQRLKGSGSSGYVNQQQSEYSLIPGEWHRRDSNSQENFHVDMQTNLEDDQISSSEVKLKNQIRNCYNSTRCNAETKSSLNEDGQTALHVAVCEGHLEMVKILLERGASANKPDARGWTPIALAEKQSNKSIYDLLLSYKNRRGKDEHRIEFLGLETAKESRERVAKPTINDVPKCSHYCHRKPTEVSSNNSNCLTNRQDTNFPTKRVTIHMKVQKHRTSKKPLPKLIILPDSLGELFQIAGNFFFLFPLLDLKSGLEKLEMQNLITTPEMKITFIIHFIK